MPTVRPERDLRSSTHTFVAFGTEDPPRFQLVFHHAIPHYQPSPATSTGTDIVLGVLSDALARTGVTARADVDVYTAAVLGLVSQQNANQPGGNRWTRQLDHLITALLHDFAAA